MSTRDLAGLPALRSFKGAFAPSVSMCAGLIPCNGNLFLGVEGMERTVRLQVGAGRGRAGQGRAGRGASRGHHQWWALGGAAQELTRALAL